MSQGAALLIDWHAHLFPPALADLLKARTDPPTLREDGARFVLQSQAGAAPMTAAPSLLSVSRRLAELDAAGVDAQVLSVPGLMGIDSVDDDSVDGLAAATNHGLAAIVADNPGRFQAFASLPLRDPVQAADALQEAVEALGLIGAIVPTAAFATAEAAAWFRPVVERAAAAGATLFVHPGPLPGAPSRISAATGINRLRHSVPGIQNDITEAAITLELTDYLDDLAGATILVANVGGNLAYLAGRWGYTQERLGEPVWDGGLRRIHVDTSSLGAKAVRFAADIFGAERLRFGTDSPIYPLAVAALEARELGIGLSDRHLIERS